MRHPKRQVGNEIVPDRADGLHCGVKPDHSGGFGNQLLKLYRFERVKRTSIHFEERDLATTHRRKALSAES